MIPAMILNLSLPVSLAALNGRPPPLWVEYSWVVFLIAGWIFPILLLMWALWRQKRDRFKVSLRGLLVGVVAVGLCVSIQVEYWSFESIFQSMKIDGYPPLFFRPTPIGIGFRIAFASLWYCAAVNHGRVLR